jgi:hypothetical protein
VIDLIAIPESYSIVTGPVVKLAFERPNIFIGKTIGLTVDRIDINKFIQQIREIFKEKKLNWRYEKVRQT